MSSNWTIPWFHILYHHAVPAVKKKINNLLIRHLSTMTTKRYKLINFNKHFYSSSNKKCHLARKLLSTPRPTLSTTRKKRMSHSSYQVCVSIIACTTTLPKKKTKVAKRARTWHRSRSPRPNDSSFQTIRISRILWWTRFQRTAVS